MRLPLLLSLSVMLQIAVNTNTAYAFNISEKSNILNSTDDFITKWTDITSEVSFYAVTDGPVNYTWSASPSGNSGSGNFNQITPDVLVTLSGLNVPSGDILTLCLEPDNLKRFYNGYLNAGSPATFSPNVLQLSELVQWGTTNWSSMQNTFIGCQNLIFTVNDQPDLSAVTSMDRIFAGAESFNQNINDWDVSNVTDMSGAFANTFSFNQPLNNWDVSSVTEMDLMFSAAIIFNMPISNWDTENVETMHKMFEDARDFNQPLNSWNVSKVTDMEFMFRSAFDFNQPLNLWDVGSVESMAGMFWGTSSFNNSLENWDVSLVENMNSMFYEASNFNGSLLNWDVSNVSTMVQMFSGATDFNQSINNWNVSNVTNMIGMFSGSSNFNQSLSDLTFHPNVNLTGFLNFTGMDCDIYSASISGWANNQDQPNNLSLFALGLQYGTNVEVNREYLINDLEWNIIGDSNSGVICDLALPVKFSSIKVISTESSHQLHFSTATEINNEKFIIEHSINGEEFQEIGSLKGEKQSTQTKEYLFVNQAPKQGGNYYRIKQVDFDGKYAYSKVVNAQFQSNTKLSIYPNPSHDVMYVKSNVNDDYQLFNSLGAIILSGMIEKGVSQLDISILTPGIYWMKTKRGDLYKIIKTN